MKRMYRTAAMALAICLSLSAHGGVGTNFSVSKTDGSDTVVAGEVKVYTIEVLNLGPGSGTVRVVDNLPAELLNPTWVCQGCPPPAAGIGNLDKSVSISEGESVTFIVTATVVNPLTVPFVENTATISSAVDNNEADNTATDTDNTISDVSFADSFEDLPP